MRWEISGATVAGEGEVKILGRLDRPWPHVPPGETHGASRVRQHGCRSCLLPGMRALGKPGYFPSSAHGTHPNLLTDYLHCARVSPLPRPARPTPPPGL